MSTLRCGCDVGPQGVRCAQPGCTDPGEQQINDGWWCAAHYQALMEREREYLRGAVARTDALLKPQIDRIAYRDAAVTACEAAGLSREALDADVVAQMAALLRQIAQWTPDAAWTVCPACESFLPLNDHRAGCGVVAVLRLAGPLPEGMQL